MSGEPLSIAALFPLGFLLIGDDPQTTSGLALAGVIATLVAGLVGRWLDNRRDERRHAWEREERLAAAAAIREDLLKNRKDLAEAIAGTTAAVAAQVESARSTLSEEHTAIDQAIKDK